MDGFNINTISDCYVGGTPASAIYIGSTLVWSSSPHDYSQDYLTFEVIDDNTTFTFGPVITGVATNDVMYSLDSGSTWTTLTSGSTTSALSTGTKIIWKCVNPTIPNVGGIGKFSSSGKFNISGNIMSLLYGDNFINQTTMPTGNYIFVQLFINAKIVNASNLILPVTTARHGCYDSMFKGCTYMTNTPTILPATTLANECYRFMFQNCSNIEVAPELPAETVLSRSYEGMFQGCTILNYVKCLATNINNSYSVTNWLNGVSATGTFVKKATMTGWSTGVSGIPTGWTVEDE